ncbi:hypothetical protein ACH4GZ_39130 [Streptomyces hygroscopicus]|uniref:hypothetical protein n=1 Tax=Streptomyces hygroscopicus TaxID=1912 RepID=UPI0037959C71
MRLSLNPRREAAIQASQKAETAVDNAEKAYNTAKDNGNYPDRVAAWNQLQNARAAAGDAREVTQDEYQKARIANGHGPDPRVRNRR